MRQWYSLIPNTMWRHDSYMMFLLPRRVWVQCPKQHDYPKNWRYDLQHCETAFDAIRTLRVLFACTSSTKKWLITNSEHRSPMEQRKHEFFIKTRKTRKDNDAHDPGTLVVSYNTWFQVRVRKEITFLNIVSVGDARVCSRRDDDGHARNL